MRRCNRVLIVNFQLGSPLGATAHPTTPMKYDYDTHATVGAGAPGNTYSGPIEGATGPQPEIKYSCSVDFSRHQSGKKKFINRLI